MKFLGYSYIWLVLLIPLAAFAGESSLGLSVYKNAQCGCCGGWIKHMESTGFHIEALNLEATELNATKGRYAIKPLYQSCHTAVFQNKYVFEGHVPAKLIKKFLANIPDRAIGLAVPAMPVGSPGMEMGDRFSPYDVLLLKVDGTHEVYVHIASYEEQF